VSNLPEESAFLSLSAFGGQSDREALRFQAFCADRLLHLLRPLPGERLLDVAAGNGIFSVAAAQAMKPSGRVTAIDQSEQLLAGLDSKISQFRIDNVDVHLMDGAHTEFRREYFHHVVCSLGLHRFPDLPLAFREWHRVLRPFGHLACASLQMQAFQPLLGLLQRRLASTGRNPEIPWQYTGNEQWLETCMLEYGFSDIELHKVQVGYHLATPDQWWEVVEHSPLQWWLQPLSFTERHQLRDSHLTEVAALQGDEGLWLNVPVLLAMSRKR